jgi:hypothetical protein
LTSLSLFLFSSPSPFFSFCFSIHSSSFFSREEFASFLIAIEINFSRKKWQQIFREIDINYDDEISFEEFFLFLFPDHDVGLALEKRRMKLLGSRVKIKADRYEKEAQRRNTRVILPFLNPHPHAAIILPETRLVD